VKQTSEVVRAFGSPETLEVCPLNKKRGALALSCRFEIDAAARYLSVSVEAFFSVSAGLLSALSLSLPLGMVADEDFLLSVMYHPEPLKTIPDG
jgi:hypothetical protein